MSPAPSVREKPRTAALERERILDAALLLLLQDGPRRMRLADLARHLGVVPSALHYHFSGGKDEVIAAVFDREEARVLEAMTLAVAAAESAQTRLLALATARLQNASRLAQLHPADHVGATPPAGVAPQAAEIQEYVMRRRQHFLDRERALISQVLRGAARRRVRDGTIDLMAAAFQGALFNVTRTFALTPSRKSNVVLAELAELFLRGVDNA